MSAYLAANESSGSFQAQFYWDICHLRMVFRCFHGLEAVHTLPNYEIIAWDMLDIARDETNSFVLQKLHELFVKHPRFYDGGANSWMIVGFCV